MPIIDVLRVAPTDSEPQAGLAQALADALGRQFGLPAGRVWVRLHTLPSARYAENQGSVPETELPAFVTVLHAWTPQGDALADEALAVAGAVAAVVGIAVEHVHVEYAPAGAGRIAFGGRLVR